MKRHNALIALIFFSSTLNAADTKPDPGEDLRHARIANKFREMDHWAFCKTVGAASRGKSKYDVHELQVLHKVALEPPRSIRPQDRSDIIRRRPALGMSMCGVFAALGEPKGVNRSVTRYGERYQLVYENPRRYVYLEGPDLGSTTVTGYQD